MKTKICPRCNKKFPLTRKYFYQNKSRKNKFDGWCKKCSNEVKKKHRQTINGYLHDVYTHLKYRCNNSKDKQYKDYGGRGIENKFKSPNEFINYVINELKIDPRGLQIDRIDNNGNYEKDNIRFVTAKENCNNRRNNIR